MYLLQILNFCMTGLCMTCKIFGSRQQNRTRSGFLKLYGKSIILNSMPSAMRYVSMYMDIIGLRILSPYMGNVNMYIFNHMHVW